MATYHSTAHNNRQLPLGDHNTDGLLVFANSLDEREVRLLYERKFPMVLIHRTPPAGLTIPFVTVENKAATRQLVDHLITVHGRRRIIFMRGPEQQEDSYWQEVGYKAALTANDIKFDENLLLQGSFEREIAYESLRNFLANRDSPPFDAVFAGDDDAAVGVYDALKEARLRIPEDVSVAGFDDSRMAPFLSPPLTTVCAPTEQVGRSTAQQLFRLLQNGETEEETLHPTEIVIRRSCGCHRVA